jgi:hypothetical protein
VRGGIWNQSKNKEIFWETKETQQPIRQECDNLYQPKEGLTLGFYKSKK